MPVLCEVRVTLSPVHGPDKLTRKFSLFHFSENDPEDKSLLHRIDIGRCSTNKNKQMVPDKSNAWFNSPVMSRNHAVLSLSLADKKLQICDNDSMHGTYLAGERIHGFTSFPTETCLTFGNKVIRGEDVFKAQTFHVAYEWMDFSLPSPPSEKATKFSNTFSNTFSVPSDGDDSDDEALSTGSPQGLMDVSDGDEEEEEKTSIPTTPLSSEDEDLPASGDFQSGSDVQHPYIIDEEARNSDIESEVEESDVPRSVHSDSECSEDESTSAGLIKTEDGDVVDEEPASDSDSEAYHVSDEDDEQEELLSDNELLKKFPQPRLTGTKLEENATKTPQGAVEAVKLVEDSQAAGITTNGEAQSRISISDIVNSPIDSNTFDFDQFLEPPAPETEANKRSDISAGLFSTDADLRALNEYREEILGSDHTLQKRHFRPYSDEGIPEPYAMDKALAQRLLTRSQEGTSQNLESEYAPTPFVRGYGYEEHISLPRAKEVFDKNNPFGGFPHPAAIGHTLQTFSNAPADTVPDTRSQLQRKRKAMEISSLIDGEEEKWIKPKTTEPLAQRLANTVTEHKTPIRQLTEEPTNTESAEQNPQKDENHSIALQPAKRQRFGSYIASTAVGVALGAAAVVYGLAITAPPV